MGFRTGSYATVWEVEPKTETWTKARISTSRKNKQTGTYETDFSGFVSFFGTAVAKKASGLHERDRIKLGDVDVTNTYNKEKGITYTNFSIYSFEMADDPKPAQQRPTVDMGFLEVPEDAGEDGLPF